MTDVRKQIDQAQQSVRMLKLTMPEIFPEWQRLKEAERALKKAQKELGSALAAWHKVGYPGAKKEPK